MPAHHISDIALEAEADHVRAETFNIQLDGKNTVYETEADLKRKSVVPIAENLVQYASRSDHGEFIKTISVASGKIRFSVIGDDGHRLDMYRIGQNYYLPAQEGKNYQLVYENGTGKTFEIVTCVDGVDVISGLAASKHHVGYILHPYETLKIEGFWKHAKESSEFTFNQPSSNVNTKNTEQSLIQNTGIIGSVVYELQVPTDKVGLVGKYAPAPKVFPRYREVDVI